MRSFNAVLLMILYNIVKVNVKVARLQEFSTKKTKPEAAETH